MTSVPDTQPSGGPIKGVSLTQHVAIADPPDPEGRIRISPAVTGERPGEALSVVFTVLPDDEVPAAQADPSSLAPARSPPRIPRPTTSPTRLTASTGTQVSTKLAQLGPVCPPSPTRSRRTHCCKCRLGLRLLATELSRQDSPWRLSDDHTPGTYAVLVMVKDHDLGDRYVLPGFRMVEGYRDLIFSGREFVGF
jgi:hypothetical protein